MARITSPQQERLEEQLGRRFERKPVQDLEEGDEICDVDHFPQKLYTGIVTSVEIIGPTHPASASVRVTYRGGSQLIRHYGETVIVGSGLVEHFHAGVEG